ncbi:MAG: CoA pyrophosphatase [Halioglobus sp.]|nr:CoA pyrophosphatase [Halioglobus sp.]
MNSSEAIFRRLETELPLAGQSWNGLAGQRLEAAVLVALTCESVPQVILGRRAMHLPLHPGEVAFPGGKREPEDTTPWLTALREAQEEVGIGPRLVYALGELSPLVTRSGFEVHPCVARVPAGLALAADPAEFDSVFLSPLEVFADRELFRLEAMSDGRKMRMVPHYQLGQDNIWGVTAAVLAQLANLVFDAGLDLRGYQTLKA